MKFKSGIYKKQGGYKSFYPTLLKDLGFNFHNEDINQLLEKTILKLGELNAYSELIPDIDFFIKMHIAKEASSSSKIEGTKTEIDELFIQEEDIPLEQRDDRNEVLKYIEALNWSIEQLEKIPLSMRLIKGAHKILLSGVRGKTKLPGQIRKSQNWIGGATLNSAFFVPPHPGDLAELLSDLEKFWHSEIDKTPHLIKAAITHYQFETIHPFLDGNGRTGRLLIILYLINFGLLKKPALYLSSYFEEYRQDYYDALTYVRTQNNLEHWIKFFLEGMILTTDDSKKIFSAILKLKEKYENIITKNMGKRAGSSLELLQKLFSKPVVTINEIQDLIQVSFPTASTIAKKFLELEIFKEKTGGTRNRIFELKEYLDLFRQKSLQANKK